MKASGTWEMRTFPPLCEMMLPPLWEMMFPPLWLMIVPPLLDTMLPPLWLMMLAGTRTEPFSTLAPLFEMIGAAIA
ncbi:hypothetical protein D3C72_518150 [compost metagenome]